MENEEKIKLKISKLLARTVENGCSTEEALTAATMAQKLIADYHIDMQDFAVDKEAIDKESRDITWLWQVHLANAVATNLCCKVVQSGKNAIFWGRETDRVVALQMYEFLLCIATNGLLLTKREARKRHYKTLKGIEAAYTNGFIDAVWAQMGRQCTALCLVIPQSVEDKVNETYSKMGTIHREQPTMNWQAKKMAKTRGYHDGKIATERKRIGKETWVEAER